MNIKNPNKNFLEYAKTAAKSGMKVQNNYRYTKGFSSKTLFMFQDDNVFIALGRSELIVVNKKNSIFLSGNEHVVYKKTKKGKEIWGTRDKTPSYIHLYNYITVVLANRM